MFRKQLHTFTTFYDCGSGIINFKLIFFNKKTIEEAVCIIRNVFHVTDLNDCQS